MAFSGIGKGQIAAVAAYVVIWLIEDSTNSRFHSDYYFDVIMLGRQYSFETPYSSEAASPYIYGVCLIVLTSLYAYMAYGGHPTEIGVFGIMQWFPLRYWFEVPFEPIPLYMLVSTWVVLVSVMSFVVIAWRAEKWIRQKGRK